MAQIISPAGTAAAAISRMFIYAVARLIFRRTTFSFINMPAVIK